MPRKVREPAVGTAFEEEARRRGFRLVAGVDEVGRGALAGPVVAAAVVLDPELPLPAGLNDSKKLTPLQRERIAAELRESALCYAVGLVPADEIDRTNILVATRRAMCEALSQLCPAADYVLIDALQLREAELPQQAIIRGDSCCASIAAASVIAKTYRDALMRELHREFPHYGFDAHVGYGTRAHWEALRRHGPCPLHRLTFRGVAGGDAGAACESSEENSAAAGPPGETSADAAGDEAGARAEVSEAVGTVEAEDARGGVGKAVAVAAIEELSAAGETFEAAGAADDRATRDETSAEGERPEGREGAGRRAG